MKIDAVAYCRYSSDNQREESITAQKRAIEKYCKENNYNLIKIYSDNALSGTSTDDRIEFKKMLNDSSKKLFEAVIVHKLDRFARNRYDSAIAKKRLKDNNVKVLSVLENLNGSPEAIITESILEGMAEYYSANLSREVKKGYNENVIQGKYCGGVIPLGLTKDSEGFYQIDTTTSGIVIELFEMRAKRIPYIQITEFLHNEHNINYNIQVIKNILSNEKYIGVLKHGKAINKNGIPPIINKDLFYAVQEVKKSRTPKRTNDETKVYYLTGIFKCGICGSPIAGGRMLENSKGGKKNYYYRCNSRNNSRADCSLLSINKNKVENFIINFIKTNILSNEILKEIVEGITKNLEKLKGQNTEVQEYNSSIKKMLSKKQRLLDLYLEGNLEKENYLKSEKEITTAISILERKIEKLKFSEKTIDPNKIKRYLLSLRKDLEKNNHDLIKGAINTFIKSIILDNESIKINYFISNGISEEEKEIVFNRELFKKYQIQ